MGSLSSMSTEATLREIAARYVCGSLDGHDDVLDVVGDRAVHEAGAVTHRPP
jgi:hypothetical protein